MSKNIPKKTSKKNLKIQPIGDRVLIKEAEKELKTAAGIFLPTSGGEKREGLKEGSIVALGRGRREGKDLIEMDDIKVGDVVLFNPGWDNKVEFDGEEYYLVTHSDISAIIG